MKYLVFIAWVLLSSCVFVPPKFQQASNLCSTIVDSALKVTAQLCNATSVDQACYGHVHLDAQSQPGFGPFQFSQAGDKIDVTGLRSLRVSPMSPTTGDWGVALLHVQANLPNANPGQNVTLLILGDVQIENKVQGQIPVSVTVSARVNVNIRQLPSLTSYVMGTLHSGQFITARGRLEDSSWLYVDLPDTADVGWVYAPSVSSTTGVQTLAVVEPDRAYFAPMQAFYIQTGDNSNPNCAEAPENGLVIQTSEGAAQVNLWINEVRIRLGSTAFIQAERNKQMTITMLEGESHVQALGVEYSAPAGTQLTIPMNQNLGPSAPPNAPVPITNANIANLPVQNLDRQITIPTLLPSATATITDTLTPSSTNTDVLTPTFAPTDTSTSIPTDVPTDTPFPTSTNTDLPTNTLTDVQTEQAEPTQTDTATPVDTPIPSDTPPVIDLLLPTPTETPTDIPPTNTQTVP
ncbi:MAG: hypothetical protein ABI700_01955 [Chloroflexota bacterium]